MTNRPPMRVQVRLPGAPQPPADRRRLLVIGGIWLLSLVLAVLGGCWMATPRDAQGQRLQAAEKRAETLQAQLTELRQKQATLEASDRISRAANTEVQSSLAERDEEIAGLRADVAFYERLVGSTSQRKGLNTHSIEFSPEAAGTWQYTAVLTQNLNRGAISQGRCASPWKASRTASWPRSAGMICTSAARYRDRITRSGTSSSSPAA